jgi:hypothetical protein
MYYILKVGLLNSIDMFTHFEQLRYLDFYTLSVTLYRTECVN